MDDKLTTYQRSLVLSQDMPLISHIEGNLWQGGHSSLVRLPAEIRYVIGMSTTHAYSSAATDAELFSFPMHDAPYVNEAMVENAAERLLECMEKAPTLVHCQAGLNRSGIVAAYTLMKRGRSADEAIHLLRTKRDPNVLFNQTFEQWLRERG